MNVITKSVSATFVLFLGILSFQTNVLAKDILLGPTGMMGQVSKGTIKVTKVEKASPAYIKVQPKNTITGVNGQSFGDDPRRELMRAIDKVESGSTDGVLTLRINGKFDAKLKLPILGSYSETAPYNCAKTDLIVQRIADKMVDTKYYSKGDMTIGWLGLMATGEKKYLDIVKAELPKQEFAHPDKEKHQALLRGEIDMGYVGWKWGYTLITLCEYYLMTGDKSVLPGIETYAMSLSLGQDSAGIWGHRMATKKRGNRLPGYSHINQPSLTCFLGLILANKCGVKNPEVMNALHKCYIFYASYIGKGTIPYGVHDPNSREFNNNGMSAIAAVAMALAGNEEGARFFSTQAATAYDRLETGHATHYFNVLWTPLGASVSGPELTQAFFQRARWLHTSYRSWDDRFTFNGGECKSGNSGGSLLLAYCLPRQALHITGKDANQSIWLKGNAVKEAIDLSQIDYKSLSIDQLIGYFGHTAPQVRRRAVWTLREREGDFSQKLLELLKKGTSNEKDSVIGYYGYRCPPEIALPQMENLAAVLNNPAEHHSVRAAAANSLSWLGEPAYKYFDDVLRLVLEKKPDDPLRLTDGKLGATIGIFSKTPFQSGLVKDKKLYYSVALSLADHKRQVARSAGMRMLHGMPKEDFPFVADKVKHVVTDLDPTYHSYHNPQTAVQAGAQVLAEHNVREGLQWALATLDIPSGKNSFKIQAVLNMLTAYGHHAKPIVEKIQQNPDLVKTFNGGRWKKKWENILKVCETAPSDLPPLVSFEDAKKN